MTREHLAGLLALERYRSGEFNADGNTAALDRYLAERESHDNCSMCGRPINGEPDIDGHYHTKHARYIDLCDHCGDDAESER